MNSRSALLFVYVTVCTVLALPRPAAAAGGLAVTINGADGMPVSGAVVIAEPLQGGAPRARSGQTVVMDQHNLMFVPDVLVVQTGTAVDFPNSDHVRHQVYSFSSAKKFELALYAGRPHAPIVFDKPGLVTLGCNIHDNMLGYIWVTDSPWYGRSDAEGKLQLHELPAGQYRVHIWHALLGESGPELEQRINVPDDQVAAARFRLTHALRAPLRNHGADKQWEDY
jgi:plastocyanin